jgi:hypothetical protein
MRRPSGDTRIAQQDVGTVTADRFVASEKIVAVPGG